MRHALVGADARRRVASVDARLAIPLGIVAAAMTSVLLLASKVWLVLILFGLCIFTASFVTRNQKLFWLTVFLATIPLNISKMFFLEPADLVRLRSSYGLFINEIEIPVLALSDLPLIVLLAIVLGEVLAQRKQIVFPRGALLAVAFIMWCGCTILVAHVPLLSVSWIYYQIKFLIIFLVIVNACITERTMRVMVAVLVLGLAIQAGLTVVSFTRQSGDNFYGSLFGVQETRSAVLDSPEELAAYRYVYEGYGLLRGASTVGVSNETAKFLVPLMPLAFVCGLFATTLRSRVFYYGSFGLGLAGLICTFSRGGLLAAAIAMIALGVLLASRGLISRRSSRAAFAASMLMALLGAPLLAAYMASRPGYLSIRFEHLRYGIQALFDHPVIGVGINNFNVAISPRDYGGVFSSMAVHNHYLRVAVETGLVGLALYLGFFLWLVRVAYRAVRSRNDFVAAVAAALLSGFIGTFFYWFDDLFYSTVLRTQFWVLFALPVVLYRLSAGGEDKVPSRTSAKHSLHRPAPPGLTQVT